MSAHRDLKRNSQLTLIRTVTTAVQTEYSRSTEAYNNLKTKAGMQTTLLLLLAVLLPAAAFAKYPCFHRISSANFTDLVEKSPSLSFPLIP